MTSFKTLMIGSAGLAVTLAAASPAAAQAYGYGYPQNNGGGIVGAIVNAVTGGYGQYPQGNYGYGQVDQRVAVQQCAAATEQRLSGNGRGQGYGAYNGNGYQNGYGNQNGYGYQSGGGGRVVGITSIERRNRGALRVNGLATSGAYTNQAYGSQYGNQGSGNQYGDQGYGNQGYGGQYGNRGGAVADLSFTCKVTLNGQISDLQIGRNRNSYNRGY